MHLCWVLVAARGIWFPDQGLNVGSLHWECGTLATGKWKSLLRVQLLAPGQNSGVGSLSLLQQIFRTQGSNPGLPRCRQTLYHLSHQGSPYMSSVQFSSVTQSCLTLRDPMNCSTPGLPVHHQLPEFTQTHVHRVSDAIQPSHLLSSPSPPALNPSQHQSLFQWVNSSHEVAKVLESQR